VTAVVVRVEVEMVLVAEQVAAAIASEEEEEETVSSRPRRALALLGMKSETCSLRIRWRR
jgi:hypothetical protein